MTISANTGLFDKVDLENLTSVNERLVEIDYPYEMEALLCYNDTASIIYAIGESMKAQEYGSIGPHPMSDLEKEKYVREVNMHRHIWGLPVGITQEAIDLAQREGRKLGNLDFLLERGFKAMKKNVESYILYRILYDMYSAFVNINGVSQTNADGLNNTNTVTWDELEDWKKAMRVPGAEPDKIIAGATLRKAILAEYSQTLGFATPQAMVVFGGNASNDFDLADGISMVARKSSKFMPDNWMIILDSSTFGKPVAIDHLHAIEVRKDQTDPFYQTGRYYHNYGAEIVYNEAIYVVKNAATTYARPAVSDFPWMKKVVGE